MKKFTRLSLATMFLSSSVGLLSTRVLAKKRPRLRPARARDATRRGTGRAATTAPETPAPAAAGYRDHRRADHGRRGCTQSKHPVARRRFLALRKSRAIRPGERRGSEAARLGAQPAEILVAFEKTAAERKDNLDEWLLRWQDMEPMKDITAQVVKVLNEGRYTRRSDTKFITDNIDRLTTSERGYVNGIRALRDSGELAVPFLVQYLRDPSKQEYQPVIRCALRDLGKYSLNPLVAATEMNDWPVLAMVCTSLGDLGYDAAVPYLAKVAANKEVPPPTRAAALAAIQKITGSSSPADTLRPGDLFYNLGEKFYYDTAAITADPRNAMAALWYWNPDRGLVKVDVVPPIFNELMTMRAAEYALKLGGSSGDALEPLAGGKLQARS